MKKNRAAASAATASVTPIAIAATAPRGKRDPLAAPAGDALYGISDVINANSARLVRADGRGFAHLTNRGRGDVEGSNMSDWNGGGADQE